jgi:site-specific recombinase XerD
MQICIHSIHEFGKYLERKGVHSIARLEGKSGQELLMSYKDDYKDCRQYWHRDPDYGLHIYLKVLKEAGLITNLPSKSHLFLPETKKYMDFLKNQKGLKERSIDRHAYWTEKLLYSLNYPATHRLDIDKIDSFIEQECSKVKRSSKSNITDAVRGFLRFMYWSGNNSTDLSRFIMSPIKYELRTLPDILRWPDIHKAISGINTNSKLGKRNYAMVLLLSTYGLRSGEIAGLKLDNIDWRNETIHITHRKAGKDLLLPLIPQVGKAIYQYLRKGRPPSKYREVFLHVKSPIMPFTPATVGKTVKLMLLSSGIKLPQNIKKGPHLFRHSFATHMVNKGASLKQIGDILGHKNPKSTCIYTKTSIVELKEVALEVPEVLS